MTGESEGAPRQRVSGRRLYRVANGSVSVAESADPAALGDTYTYTTTVTNNGTDPATGVSTTVTLSGTAARTIVSATSTQGSCAIAAPTVTCTIASHACSARIDYRVKLTALSSATVASGWCGRASSGRGRAAER